MYRRFEYPNKTQCKAYLLNEFSPISEGIIYTFNNPYSNPTKNKYTGNYEIHENKETINFELIISKIKDLRGYKIALIDNQKKGKIFYDRIFQFNQISLDSTNLKIFMRFLKKTIKEGEKYVVETILQNIEINSIIENNDGKSFLECDVEKKNEEIIKNLFDKDRMLSDFSSIMPPNFFSGE